MYMRALKWRSVSRVEVRFGISMQGVRLYQVMSQSLISTETQKDLD